MRQTSENEQAEQIWSGWSKFGVGGADVGRTVWRVADNLAMLLFKFLFSWAKFVKLDTYIILTNHPGFPWIIQGFGV